MPVFGEKRLQPFDPTLEKIAMLGTTADRLIYTIAVDTWAEAMLTTAGRALLDDADAAAQRATLGLGTMATQSASAVAIAGGTITGITDLAVADGGTGTSTGSITGTGALVFTAGGTNQDVTLTPSGTGNTILNGNVGIGTASPSAKLHLVDDGTGIKITRGTVITQWFTSLDGPAYIGTETADDFHIRINAENRITILSTGNVGIGTASPTAVLHLKAGTATANTSPLKLTAGTNLTTPENGAIEFDGTNIYITIGGVRKTIQVV